MLRVAPGRTIYKKFDGVLAPYSDPVVRSRDEEQAALIVAASHSSGWIASFPDRLAIRPYMAHYGALGLLSCYERNPVNPLAATWLSTATSWASWYGDHLDVDGYVHDWTVADPGGAATLTDLGSDSMDSTDAYAGMWLLLLSRIAEITGSTNHINWTQVNLCLDGIEATQQSDGLTWAKPSYTAKYLEDNIECLAGLRAIAPYESPSASTVVGAVNYLNNDIQSWTLRAVQPFTVSSSATISELEVYSMPGGLRLVVGETVAIQNAAGTRLGSFTLTVNAIDAWNTYTLDTPVNLEPGLTYRLEIDSPNAAYIGNSGNIVKSGIIDTIGQIRWGAGYSSGPLATYCLAWRLRASPPLRVLPMGDAMAQGVSSMWNESDGSWDWAIDGSGGRTSAIWSLVGEGESSLRQQVWSLIYNATPDDLTVRQSLIDRYLEQYPDWDTSITLGYEVMTAVALNHSGEHVTSVVGADSLYDLGSASDWDWPWATLTAGQWLLYAASEWPFPDLGLDVNMRLHPNLLEGVSNTTSTQDSNADGLATGWTPYFTGTTTASLVSGRQRLQSDATAVTWSGHVPVTAGQWYTWSVYQQAATIGAAILKVEWFNASNSLVDYAYHTWPDPTDGEERRWISLIAPATTTYAVATMGIDSGGGDLYLRAPKFEPAGAPTPYVMEIIPPPVWFADNFNRSDALIANNWSFDYLSYVYTLSNTAKTQTTDERAAYRTTGPYSKISATLVGLPASGYVGLLARYVDSSNFLAMVVNSAGAYQVQKKLAGTTTTLATGSAGVFAAGDVLSVGRAGNDFTIQRNNVVVGSITVTDFAITANRQVGMYWTSTAALDNFEIRGNSLAGVYSTQVAGWWIHDMVGAAPSASEVQWGLANVWIQMGDGGSAACSGYWAAQGSDGTIVRSAGGISGNWSGPGLVINLGMFATQWFGTDVLRRIVVISNGVTVVDFMADWPIVRPL